MSTFSTGHHDIHYHHGLHQSMESEALPNALPRGQNSPQHVPYGLYAEQLNGSAFTASSHENYFAWLYRILPSVVCGEFTPYSHPHLKTPPFENTHTPPTAMRWQPLPYPTSPVDFIDSLFTIAGHGSPDTHQGAALHYYTATKNMENRYFYNADGELLIIPQEGGLRCHTEFGILDVHPTEIAVIPRGVKFQVSLHDREARGYVCENFGRPFRLPEHGLIGANGLAAARDFLTPVAHFENRDGDFTLLTKFQGQCFSAPLTHSPLNVVAWHGNYAPYVYDLKKFNVLNTVSHDHPDPSIFTVLSSPSHTPGVANVDLVIFPPRWLVANHTFRPPYYHRNIMSELMGLIRGRYDAKSHGFLPGGWSLHNAMTAHGPDQAVYDKAIQAELTPEYLENTLAFMLESQSVWRLTAQALMHPSRDANYLKCWTALQSHFKSDEHML